MSLQESIALQNPLLARPAEPNALFAPYRLGDLDLSNRLVMSPMTRSRALEGNVPNPLAATYYAQRASAGLIVTEATQVSPQGVGYIRTPGIHSAEQVRAWRASGRQQNLRPALARRTRLASRFPRRRTARRPLRFAGGRRGVHHPGADQIGDPPRARNR